VVQSLFNVWMIRVSKLTDLSEYNFAKCITESEWCILYIRIVKTYQALFKSLRSFSIFSYELSSFLRFFKKKSKEYDIHFEQKKNLFGYEMTCTFLQEVFWLVHKVRSFKMYYEETAAVYYGN